MSARSSVLPPAGLTDPWLARVWRAFRAKSLSPSHLRILVALHEAAASGGATATQLVDRTGYSRSVVSTALSHARALGLVYRESPGPRQVLFRPLRSR
jgi:DNA-binding MarR family transcriptional regulator